MSLKFEDFDTEKYFIASLLKGPGFWKNNIPESWLKEDLARKTYIELKKFLEPPYSTYPSEDIAVEKIESLDIKLFIKECSTLKVEPHILNVKLYDLYEMYAARKVYDMLKKIPNEMEQTRVEEVVRAKIAEMSELVNPFMAGTRERGFIYESASARWDRYRKIEKDPLSEEKIPYGIAELDKYTNGGVRPGHIVTFFAESGGFKTKLKLCIAYNFAFVAKKDVMVITLEVPKNDYESLIDSRHSFLEFNDIVSGKLGPNRTHYRDSLINMDHNKPSLYVVDIPDRATSADLITESELYYTKFGKYPDAVILDYVNEMEPLQSWNNSGEKYKNLGVETRRIVRTYKYGYVTSMQENREGKKIKDKEKTGTEHVGESHSWQNVCHLLAHIYQDADGIDAALNQLHIGIKKNRYGPKNVGFAVWANAAVNYIGDKTITTGSM